MNKTLICLPTLNEVGSIAQMIENIRALNLDVIVTDGGSIDGTVDIARQLGVKVLQRKNRSKSYGIRHAMQYAGEAGYEIFGYIDCDMTYPANRFKEMMEKISDYDLIVGARKMNHIKPLNRVANLFFSGLINFLFRARLKDTQSGMRLLLVHKFSNVLDADGFDLETEITCKALTRHYKTFEVEIDYYERVGESKVRFWDAVSIFFRIIKERFS